MGESLRSLRILLVENHDDTASYLKMYLEQLGDVVEVASDMATALALFPSTTVDLLLCDIALPDGNGWELMQRIEATRPPFAVAMSGYSSQADQARSRAAGFRHHLVKPFLPDELEPILEEARRASACA